ncbi:outer membrane beta-barrel domain-containing protein, partial [bacterium]|nr:outer membrane beta-barrel domain-containing protein [bacterium]
VVPAIDFPLRSYMAVVNWYPVYGKVSWFESAVSQFDFYLTAGGGQVQLNSGNSPIFTGGIGMGMWVNSWLTSRVEVRYQNYQDRVFTGERNIDAVVMQFGLGFML